MKYQTPGNASFDSLPPELAPKLVYAEGTLDDISPGCVVTDELGIRYKVGKMALMCQSPRIVYQVVLTPLPQS
ncbi:hypothetical protein L4X63_22560 [Geomonas sp. Red32]|uniref:hypothetical protein n=1 Tax=Geomonas sp. Red32 TaxID=2912856 RepID=UPI00202CD5B3|nr:hypothetical protein [Geomonas sp. Red32]MCM0084372.1 hypothetical protein [Geomonas sp. Red32]